MIRKVVAALACGVLAGGVPAATVAAHPERSASEAGAESPSAHPERSAAESKGAPPATGVLTKAPVLTRFVPAEYPPTLAAEGVTGAVVLDLVIDETGAVTQATIAEPSAHPAFDAAAIHAVTQFEFEPAEIDGKPAAVQITYRYEFVLKKVTAPAAPSEAP
ncbi:MAG: energy transducer TonB, partial [Anaeromyxobacteraceae bacterium]